MPVIAHLGFAATFFVIAIIASSVPAAPRAPAAVPAPATMLKIEDAGAASDPKRVEIRGVAAGAFDPALWQKGALHLLPDARHPLLAPREGKFRNIYAPSVVQMPDGAWHVYYGGWDGEAKGNDHIYLARTRDFHRFDDRRTVIDPNVFQHVCNVNVMPAPAPGDGYAMMCTAYPDARGRNKPVTFLSPDGLSWNASTDVGGFPAGREQIIGMSGLDHWDDADVNGMNVLLCEDGRFRVYFSSFGDFGKVWRASGDDGKRFTLDGIALEERVAVNDVKRFLVTPPARANAAAGGGDDSKSSEAAGRDDAIWYLAGFHMNGPSVFYALGQDGLCFPPTRELLRHRDDADQYIVAVGFVVAGEQDRPGRSVLGLLYGAGAAPTLDRNRIFARWLQKKAIAAIADGRRIAPTASLGPDMQLIDLPAETRARVELFAEDGITPIATSGEIALKPGRAYSLDLTTSR